MQNILVVDDEEPVRRLLRDCLELDGYEVREAADAMQAIDRIGEDLPDCMLLDVMMPGMSGLELLEKLREDPRTVNLPVLMLTAATDDETTWAGWANGASCYVPKPFDIDHMLDWVSRLCAPTAGPEMGSDVFELADGSSVDLAEVAAAAAAAARPAAGPPRTELDSSVAAVSALMQDPMSELTAIFESSLPSTSAVPLAPAAAAAAKPTAAASAPATPAAPDWSANADGPATEELIRAMDTGQFWVAYQPIIALSSEQVVGVEALARWAHPHRGDLAPNEFLALAERAGLADRLDDVIFREALQQVSEWNAVRSGAGLEGLTLSINVSPDRLMHPGFCANLREALATYEMPPASVVLELSEVALMRLLAGDQKVVRDLLELGVSLAFDDFSAAATSLGYLQRFHVDVVKIDRSLIRTLGLDDNHGDDSTVAAIISIAHRLGRAVVAEGVETADQAADLRRLGCEYAQGFHFGFPASAAHLGRRLVTANV